MKQFVEALERGKVVRKLQDEALALFVKQIQNINDVDTLKHIIEELKGGK
ncbi:hypothetical protein [Bacillus sp. RO1]|nr:hypothetical protein [Bacillus sp. RO1]NLP51279.1 hypothetical protein [Bacillus sp. RO1]